MRDHVARELKGHNILAVERFQDKTRYLVFFKGRDADVMTAAFQEFSAKKLNREKKPSIRKALAAAKDKAKQLNAARDKVKKMDRGREI